MNDQYRKHVGYSDSTEGIAIFFSNDMVKYISKEVTRHLEGKVIVPCDKITHVMNAIYDSFRPSTGDIHTRYSIPTEDKTYLQDLVDQTINVIVRSVRDHLQTEDRNRQLSVWSSVYGTFNKHGLLAHQPIKILNKHPRKGLFNENY